MNTYALLKVAMLIGISLMGTSKNLASVAWLLS